MQEWTAEQRAALQRERFEARLREVKSWISDKRGDGTLRCDLIPYLTPWPEAVEQNREAWNTAKAWTREKGNIIAIGPTGVGKSALCRYILAKQMWAGCDVADFSAVEFATKLTGYSHEVLFERAKKTPVLILDDFDKAPFTPRVLAFFWELIDHRVENWRPTFITSNVDVTNLHRAICEVTPGNTSFATSILGRLRPHVELTMGGANLRQLRAYGSWERTQ